MVQATGSTGAKAGGEQGYADDEGSEQCMAVRGGGGGGGDGCTMAVMEVAGRDVQAAESATAVVAAAAVTILCD